MTGMPPFDPRNSRPAALDVTPGVDVDSSNVKVYVRGLVAVVNVNATTTDAIGTIATLFILPVGCRPPVTIYGTLIQTSGAVPIRVHVQADGIVQNRDAALASGAILRGQIVIPL